MREVHQAPFSKAETENYCLPPCIWARNPAYPVEQPYRSEAIREQVDHRMLSDSNSMRREADIT